jgi:Mrp family chromosome partitioning ATPase
LVAPTTERSDGHSFDVLVAGVTPPPNPGELIESKAMESLLAQAKAMYDLVVIDTPPLTAVSDAFPLLKKVDGVVIVGRVGRNRRDVAERLHETLTGAGAPLLGVIANGFKSARRGGYGYGYDYAPAKPEPPGRHARFVQRGRRPRHARFVQRGRRPRGARAHRQRLTLA